MKAVVALGLLMMSLLASAETEIVDFTLPDLKGQSHSLSQYRGKWVVVNYWATWCPPCLEEIPDLIKFHDLHKDRDAVVLGVNYEDIGQPWLEEFVDSMFVSYPVLRSEPTPRTPFGDMMGLPTTYIVSPEGRAVARQVGPITLDALESFLKRKQAERAVSDAGVRGSR